MHTKNYIYIYIFTIHIWSYLLWLPVILRYWRPFPLPRDGALYVRQEGTDVTVFRVTYSVSLSPRERNEQRSVLRYCRGSVLLPRPADIPGIQYPALLASPRRPLHVRTNKERAVTRTTGATQPGCGSSSCVGRFP